MSTEVDQNAQAAEDAKKMLAELQGESAGAESALADAKTETKEDQESKDVATNGDKKSEEKTQDRSDRHRERRDNDRGQRGGRGGRGGGRGGRGGNKNFRDNIKSDLTSQEVTDDPVAIRKQIEFYFSDSNLPMDKFLLGKVGGSQNNPVEIETIHSFKRMRRFQPFEAIVNALKESTFLELVDDNKSVRRREPLPESLADGSDSNAVKVFEDKAMPRSIYAKGFGEEVPATQFDIEAFFAPHGPTNAIRLRRSDDKIFKGSVFVEFESEELAQKFLKQDPKPQYKGKSLQIMSKKEYCDKKVDDINAGRIQANTAGRTDRRHDTRNGRDKRKRDDEDNRDWKQRRNEDRKNGFRDDKKRGGRDSRGRDGGRRQEVEKDERGIPTIKTSGPSEAKAEALARAKAAVEAENKKEDTADNIESTEQSGTQDAKKEAADAVAASIKADSEAVTKKREREDDEGDAEREVKKVNTEAETAA